MMDNIRKATIIDVARLAGVSTATAGRVLGGYGYSSEGMKDRVLKAAESLGYRPNQLARSLITGQTRTIGFVAGDIQSPFYAKILRGVSDAVKKEGFGLLITNSDETIEEEMRSIQLLAEKQVDGLIVSPCDIEGADHLRKLAESIPLVLIDREVNGLAVDTVGTDNVSAAKSCIAQLIAHGHRRIGVVGEFHVGPWSDLESFVRMARRNPSPNISLMYPSWQRLLGYLYAHDEAGVPVDLSLIARVNSYSIEDTRRTVMNSLSRQNGPTALFTTDGLMTQGTMSAVASLGLNIPKDISLIAFDDLDWMSFVPPGIDAIAQPRRNMGETAARMLMERINGLETGPRRVNLASRRIRRGSVRRQTETP